MKIKDMTTTELLLARQWLAAVQGEVGIFSANKDNKLLYRRMKDVDTELWVRIVSEEGEGPPWRRNKPVSD